MGTSLSKELVPPFTVFADWSFNEANALQEEYKNKDYDFGIDAQTIQKLCCAIRKDLPTSLGQDILKAFSKTNSGIINALSLVGGVVFISIDTDDGEKSIQKKSKVIFEAFDFEGEGEITLDEMTICLLSVLRAVSIMTGRKGEPTDAGMEQLCLEAFRNCGQDPGDFITLDNFSVWTSTKIEPGMSACKVLKKFELLDKEAVSRRNTLKSPIDIGNAPFGAEDLGLEIEDVGSGDNAAVPILMSQSLPETIFRASTPVKARLKFPLVTYCAPSMGEIKKIAAQYADCCSGQTYQKAVPVKFSEKKKNYLYAAPPFSVLKARANQFAEELASLSLSEVRKGSISASISADVMVFVPVADFVPPPESKEHVTDVAFLNEIDVEEAAPGDQSALPPPPPPETAPASSGPIPAFLYQAPNFKVLQARAAKFAIPGPDVTIYTPVADYVPAPESNESAEFVAFGTDDTPEAFDDANDQGCPAFLYQAPSFESLQAKAAEFAEALSKLSFKTIPNGTAVTVLAHMQGGLHRSTKSGFIVNKDGVDSYSVMYPRYNTQEIEREVLVDCIKIGFSRMYASKVKSTRFSPKMKSEYAKQCKDCKMLATGYSEVLMRMKKLNAARKVKYSVAGSTHMSLTASFLSVEPLTLNCAEFSTGSLVSANFCGLGWKDGTVLSVNKNKTLNILYKNGAREVFISMQNVKAAKDLKCNAIPVGKLSPGCLVTANFCGLGWRTGTVTTVNTNKTVNILFTNGAKEVFVSTKKIKNLECNVAMDEFSTGSLVSANFCGLGWRNGTVICVNANGTLNIQYLNGAREVFVSRKKVGPPILSVTSHRISLTKNLGSLEPMELAVFSEPWPVGYPVSANFCGMEWRSGKICKVNSNNSYDVLFDNGAKEVQVSQKKIKALYFVGCHIFANFCGLDWREGVIEKINTNCSFNIQYVNGAKEVFVSPKHVRQVLKDERNSISSVSHQVTAVDDLKLQPVTSCRGRLDSVGSVSSITHMASVSMTIEAQPLMHSKSTYSVASISHITSNSTIIEAPSLCSMNQRSDSHCSVAAVTHLESESTTMEAEPLKIEAPSMIHRSDSQCSVASMSHVVSNSTALETSALIVSETFCCSAISHIVSKVVFLSCPPLEVSSLFEMEDATVGDESTITLAHSTLTLGAVLLDLQSSAYYIAPSFSEIQKRAAAFAEQRSSMVIEEYYQKADVKVTKSNMQYYIAPSSSEIQKRAAAYAEQRSSMVIEEYYQKADVKVIIRSQLNVSYEAPLMDELKLIAKQYTSAMDNFKPEKYYRKARVIQNFDKDDFIPDFGLPVIVRGMQGTIELVHEDGTCTIKFEDGHTEKHVATKFIYPRKSIYTPRTSVATLHSQVS